MTITSNIDDENGMEIIDLEEGRVKSIQDHTKIQVRGSYYNKETIESIWISTISISLLLSFVTILIVGIGVPVHLEHLYGQCYIDSGAPIVVKTCQSGLTKGVEYQYIIVVNDTIDDHPFNKVVKEDRFTGCIYDYYETDNAMVDDIYQMSKIEIKS